MTTVPAWFLEELRLQSPRLKVEWRRYQWSEIIVPLIGAAWQRTIEPDGTVEYCLMDNDERPAREFVHEGFRCFPRGAPLPPPDPKNPKVVIEDDFGSRWIGPPVFTDAGPAVVRPQGAALTDGRHVILEQREGQRPAKILDVVEAGPWEPGKPDPVGPPLLLHPLDRYVLERLVSRRMSRAEADAEWEANEAAAKEKRDQDFHDGHFDGFMRFAESRNNIPRLPVAAEPPAPAGDLHPAGFRVIDRRANPTSHLG